MAKTEDKKLKNVINKLTNLSTVDNSSPINQFINRLVEEKKFPSDLTDDVKKILREDLMRRLNDFITIRTIAALTDDDIITLNKMLDEKKPDSELQKFVSEHVPDYTNFLTATLLEFREVYLGLNPPSDVAERTKTDISTLPISVPPAPVAPPMLIPKNQTALNKTN